MIKKNKTIRIASCSECPWYRYDYMAEEGDCAYKPVNINTGGNEDSIRYPKVIPSDCPLYGYDVTIIFERN